MSRTPRLQPLGARQPDSAALTRVSQAWPFLVGPALAPHTRPLRVQRGVLIMGCWDLTRIAPLREACRTVWPQLRQKIQRALRLELAGLQVEPCDPPDPAPRPSQEPDPLRRALDRLEAAHLERVRLGLDPS